MSLQKKIALINDLSGFGRCSLAVQLPVVSVLKNEALLMPTCLLSNHTAYDHWYLKDLSEDLAPWCEEWKHLPIELDGILTGYLSSAKQISSIQSFLKDFKKPDTFVLVDPVMGDDGSLYSGFDQEIVNAMKQLIKSASLITPNTTEACALAQKPWSSTFSAKEMEALAATLQNLGPESVLITGIHLENGTLADLLLEKDQFIWRKCLHPFPSRHGTGDLFSAALIGTVVQGQSLQDALFRSAQFVEECLRITQKMQVPQEEGCAFEEVLGFLLLPEHSC